MDIPILRPALCLLLIVASHHLTNCQTANSPRRMEFEDKLEKHYEIVYQMDNPIDFSKIPTGGASLGPMTQVAIKRKVTDDFFDTLFVYKSIVGNKRAANWLERLVEVRGLNMLLLTPEAKAFISDACLENVVRRASNVSPLVAAKYGNPPALTAIRAARERQQ